jgi:hypothetical protein
VTFYRPDGNTAAGYKIDYMLKSIPSGSGVAYIGTTVSATSGSNGVATATLWRGGVYEAFCNSVKVADVTVPAAANYTLPSIKVK